MTSRIRHLTIDSNDPFVLATFWAQVLGGRLDDDDHPGDPEAIVHGCDPELLFVTVPEAKQVKNRVHLDVVPHSEATQAGEIERILALGASLVADRRTPQGRGWAVLADPEGNELCVGWKRPD
jgi:predicted enzyme related to lactoylglutathione lyase